MEARGGRLGGGGTATGERVIVRFDGTVLDVFDETTALRFHAELIDRLELADTPAPSGTKLVVNAARRGCAIPVRFEGAELEALQRIIAAVRDSRG